MTIDDWVLLGMRMGAQDAPDTAITLQEIVTRRNPFLVTVGGKLYEISVKELEQR